MSITMLQLETFRYKMQIKDLCSWQANIPTQLKWILKNVSSWLIIIINEKTMDSYIVHQKRWPQLAWTAILVLPKLQSPQLSEMVDLDGIPSTVLPQPTLKCLRHENKNLSTNITVSSPHSLTSWLFEQEQLYLFQSNNFFFCKWG